jgi:hypothetical protein
MANTEAHIGATELVYTISESHCIYSANFHAYIRPIRYTYPCSIGCSNIKAEHGPFTSSYTGTNGCPY